MINFDELSNDVNTQLALHSLCSAAVKLVNADAAFITFAHPDRHEVIASDGFDADTLPRILNPVSFSAQAIGAVTNLDADPRFRAMALCNGEIDRFAALIWAPLSLEGRCFGMVEMCFRDGTPPFWEAERNALARVAKGARDLIRENPGLSAKVAAFAPTPQRRLI